MFHPKSSDPLIIVSAADLSEPTAGKTRIVSFASALQKQQIDVSLIATLPPQTEPIREARSLKLHLIPYRAHGSIVGHFKMMKSIINKTKDLQKDKRAQLQIEGSITGGYLALAGFSNYILDINDLIFPGVKYGRFFFCKPPLLKLYQEYMSCLEKMAIRRAARVIAVSQPMKEFMTKRWKVPERKVAVIPNGYFEAKVKNFYGMKETEQMVSFVGYLIKWARPDKVIAAAKALRDDGMTFYIVGDGPYRSELELMVQRHNLSNVIFTGFVPVDKAYEILAKSQVVLFPFAKSLLTDVSCPVKLLDYMGLGKAMVIDNVSEVALMLKENDAALVCDPDNDSEFIDNIRLLCNDEALRVRIASKARQLAVNFSWEKQGEKLARLVEGITDSI